MKKFENFCKALDNLEDIYKYEEPYDNVVLTGLVALYEICFEQSWKAVKEVLSENGIEEAATGSPRSIIKLAYSVNLIKIRKSGWRLWYPETMLLMHIIRRLHGYCKEDQRTVCRHVSGTQIGNQRKLVLIFDRVSSIIYVFIFVS